MRRNRLTGKDPDAGDRRQEEKWVTEDGMVGWHPQLNGHEFEQSVGDGEGQANLVCASPWGHKELGTTEWLNNSYNLFSLLELLVVTKWGSAKKKKTQKKPKNPIQQKTKPRNWQNAWHTVFKKKKGYYTNHNSYEVHERLTTCLKCKKTCR